MVLSIMSSPWKLPISLPRRHGKTSATNDEIDTWVSVNDDLTRKHLDTQYWWNTIGYSLAVFLEYAGYTPEAQHQYLAFFHSSVAPELGRRPGACSLHERWQSFMTDDFTPVEISWDWGFSGERGTIRYSIEPIGSQAGSAVDPLNQYAGARFLERMSQSVPGTNLEWCKHFQKEFCVFDSPVESDRAGHKSRFFAAFDLDGSSTTLKSYFFPTFKAIETGQSKIEVLSSAISRLPEYSSEKFSAFGILRNYVELPPTGDSIDVEILAVDCTRPDQGRLKIYARSRSTSFESAKTILTLGGGLASPKLDQSLQQLEVLWRLLFGSGRTNSEPMLSRDHRTAGILYNFEIRPGSPLPVPKIYLPVRHYSQSDSHILEGLGTYFQKAAKGLESYNRYTEAMTKLM